MFVDQKEGIIYSYDESSDEVSKIYDVSSDALPEGINLDTQFPYWKYTSLNAKSIHMIAPGPDANTMIALVSDLIAPRCRAP